MAKIKGETIEVIRSKFYKLAGIKCDVCGQIIRPPVKYSDLLNNENKYFSVTTGHHDWGIESIESIKDYDICPNCIIGFVKDYLGSIEAHRSGEINVTTEHVQIDSVLNIDPMADE